MGVFRAYANTIPFYIRNLEIHRFWYLKGPAINTSQIGKIEYLLKFIIFVCGKKLNMRYSLLRNISLLSTLLIISIIFYKRALELFLLI